MTKWHNVLKGLFSSCPLPYFFLAGFWTLEIFSLPYSLLLDYSTFGFTTLPYPTRNWKTTTLQGLLMSRQCHRLSICTLTLSRNAMYRNEQYCFSMLAWQIDRNPITKVTSFVFWWLTNRKPSMYSAPRTMFIFTEIQTSTKPLY